MAGALPPGMSEGPLMNQAQEVWKMLDNMAASDPQEYQKFIKTQMKEAKQSMKPPEPHMCVKTNLLNPTKRIFINVFEWHKIPGPKDDQAPIPVMGGPSYRAHDEKGDYKCVAVAFCPDVLKEFGINSKYIQEQKMLINLAIDYLEDRHKCKISRKYILLDEDHVCTGSVKIARQSLTSSTTEEQKEFERNLDELEKSFGPLAKGCKDSLLNELSSIGGGEDDQTDLSTIHQPILPRQSELKLPGQISQPKKGLIEELSGVGSKLPEPVYDLVDESADDASLDKLKVKVHLPGIKSMSQCQLDISERNIQLLVPDEYQLQLDLPKGINQSEASAKFSRKSCVLTLILPVVETKR